MNRRPHIQSPFTVKGDRDCILAYLGRPYFSSSLTIIVRFSSWCASAIQLREMLRSTVDRRAEISGSHPRVLYSAANILHSLMEIIESLPIGMEATCFSVIDISARERHSKDIW
jgi:hypothetical protein